MTSSTPNLPLDINVDDLFLAQSLADGARALQALSVIDSRDARLTGAYRIAAFVIQDCIAMGLAYDDTVSCAARAILNKKGWSA